MKQFSCGDVVPGCQAGWTAETEQDLLRAVAAHAADDHGISPVPPELAEQVRLHIVTVDRPSR